MAQWLPLWPQKPGRGRGPNNQERRMEKPRNSSCLEIESRPDRRTSSTRTMAHGMKEGGRNLFFSTPIHRGADFCSFYLLFTSTKYSPFERLFLPPFLLRPLFMRQIVHSCLCTADTLEPKFSTRASAAHSTGI